MRVTFHAKDGTPKGTYDVVEHDPASRTLTFSGPAPACVEVDDYISFEDEAR